MRLNPCELYGPNDVFNDEPGHVIRECQGEAAFHHAARIVACECCDNFIVIKYVFSPSLFVLVHFYLQSEPLSADFLFRKARI